MALKGPENRTLTHAFNTTRKIYSRDDLLAIRNAMASIPVPPEVENFIRMLEDQPVSRQKNSLR